MNRSGTGKLVLAAVLFAGCDEDLINPMSARQEKVGNYSESEFYDDKMSMREPPANTVPRERFVRNEAFTSGKTTNLAGESSYVTTFPLRVDRPLLELGRLRFTIICATCHGPVGDGDSIVARQMALRPPPSLHNYTAKPAGYLFEVVTKGFGLMASYAAELPVRERWAVVAYVRALQISQSSPLDMAPPDERSRLIQSPAEADQPPLLTPPPGGIPGKENQ